MLIWCRKFGKPFIYSEWSLPEAPLRGCQMLVFFTFHVIKENAVRSDLFCGCKHSDFINNIPILTDFLKISFDQQSEYNVFHKLMSWQESSLWTN